MLAICNIATLIKTHDFKYLLDGGHSRSCVLPCTNHVSDLGNLRQAKTASYMAFHGFVAIHQRVRLLVGIALLIQDGRLYQVNRDLE